MAGHWRDESLPYPARDDDLYALTYNPGQSTYTLGPAHRRLACTPLYRFNGFGFGG